MVIILKAPFTNETVKIYYSSPTKKIVVQTDQPLKIVKIE